MPYIKPAILFKVVLDQNLSLLPSESRSYEYLINPTDVDLSYIGGPTVPGIITADTYVSEMFLKEVGGYGAFAARDIAFLNLAGNPQSHYQYLGTASPVPGQLNTAFVRNDSDVPLFITELSIMGHMKMLEEAITPVAGHIKPIIHVIDYLSYALTLAPGETTSRTFTLDPSDVDFSHIGPAPGIVEMIWYSGECYYTSPASYGVVRSRINNLELRSHYINYSGTKETGRTSLYTPIDVGMNEPGIENTLEITNDSDAPLSLSAILIEGALKMTGYQARRCAIATAAYGSPLEPKLAKLRSFRDRCLPTPITNAYYRMSPPIANLISRHPKLRFSTRQILDIIL